jgi:integrase
VTTSRKLNNLKSVLDVLTAAGMLDDDREPALDTYVHHHAGTLAEPMAAEFRQWYEVLRDGTTAPPRSRPRKPGTVRKHVYTALPILHAWTAAGYQSLREISRQDILDILPKTAHRRRQALATLRALFRYLKARKVVFTNPTARIRGVPVVTNQPLPLDLAVLREAINSDAPARAALAALIGFHALRVNELVSLQLTDIRDGRLGLGGRTILLAEPVRAKIARWLDERARRWPNTVNPHLFVNLHSAGRTGPVNLVWVTETVGVSAQAIREDRILHEAMTTAGDIRRLCDLFGLTIGGAERYLHTTEQTMEPAGS